MRIKKGIEDRYPVAASNVIVESRGLTALLKKSAVPPRSEENFLRKELLTTRPWESFGEFVPKLSVHETPVLTFPTYYGFPARLSSE